MRVVILLSISLFICWSPGLSAQADGLRCDLAALAEVVIRESPTIELQRIRTDRAQVGKQSAASTFDYQLFSDVQWSRSGNNLLSADPRTAIVGNQIQTNNFTLSGGLQRTFRSNLTTTVEVAYTRVADNYPLTVFNEQIGPYVPDNATSTTLSFRYPLLRGNGREIATAGERVAATNLKNQEFNTDFLITSQVFETAVSYWQYLTAEQMMGIYQENEDRVRRVLEITTELVEAEKKPMGDLLQVQADLKDKERQTILAKQQLFAARQNLGRTLGLDEEESTALTLPLSPFPVLEEVVADITLPELIEIARANRADLKALERALEIARINISVAKNDLRPQLDATSFVNYGGVDNGNGLNRIFTALGQREGRNYQIGFGLSYFFPVNNNQAEASLRDNQLLYSSQEVALQNQIRNIELNVSIAYNNFLNSVEALKKSRESLAYYQEVFSNEQIKFRSGLTTLLNLILLQERLTFAQLDYVQNQQQFALAISELRFETGTLVPQTQDTDQLDVFYTLPTN